METPRAIVLGSWLVFMGVWLAMAFGTKKSVHRQPGNERRAYTVPLLLGILAMSSLWRFVPPLAFMGVPVLSPAPALHWTGAAAALLGLAIALWARITLGRNWSGVVTLKADHALVTAGPYAAIRHPIYTALILLFVALALFMPSPGALLGLALIVWSCWVKLHQEEALMLQQFPQDYPGYMTRTKRLVPGLL